MRDMKVISVLMVVAAFISGGFYYSTAASLINREVDLLELKAAELAEADAAIKKLQAKITELDREQAPARLSIKQRAYWVELLDYLNSCIESDAVWITSLEFSSGDLPRSYTGNGVDCIELKGLVRENPLDGRVVYAYADRLQLDARNAAKRGQIPKFDIADLPMGEFFSLGTGQEDRMAMNWEMTLPLPAGYPMR